MLVTIHNNADQTFWIFYFLCVFGFLTQKQVKIDQKQCKNIQSKQQTNKQKLSTLTREITQKHITNQCHKTQEVLMHGHVVILMHEYLSSPTRTCIWGDIPIGLGTSVVTVKPYAEACQTSGECINHLHHVHYSRITISTS